MITRLFGEAFSVTLCGIMIGTLPISALADNPSVVHEVKHDRSQPLRDLAALAVPSPPAQHVASFARATGSAIVSSAGDPVAHIPSSAPMQATVLLNFDGLSAADTVASGGPFVPPDTNGAVGASQFVEWVNVTFEVFDKATGRWIAAQPVFSAPFSYCVAVSTTSDATGSYNRYAFPLPAFPDYPKLGVWPDAYYVTYNIFSPSFAGALACAYDRASMLAGNAATAVCFQQPKSVGSLLPSDVDSATPPPSGEPNFLLDLADSTHLNLFRFHVDFSDPANSTFSGPTEISVAPYSELCARATDRACIPQPFPGEKVDSLGDRLMYRLGYRKFRDHESLVATHSIEGGAFSGVRWYEIRNPASTPVVFQQGTVVNPAVDYWMGSIAMDKVGNIALRFSMSSDSVYPGVAGVGRTAADPLGQMDAPLILVNGTGAQVKSFKRWGDYSSMSVDPEDGCTLWYSQEYYKTTGAFNWNTRVARSEERR